MATAQLSAQRGIASQRPSVARSAALVPQCRLPAQCSAFGSTFSLSNGLAAGSPCARRQAAAVVASARPASRRSAVAVRAEISYVMVKPDGVQRGLVGEIISRFERKGFKLVGLKLFQTPKDIAEEHYKDLSSKPFYNALVSYIVSGPVVAMVLEGNGVVASARKLIGATNPLQSEPGTIRGDFGIEVGRNIVHGSDSVDNGAREAALWFPEGTVSWSQTIEPWLKE